MAAVGSVAITEITASSVKLVEFAWTSSAGGAVSGILTAGFYSGEVSACVTAPGTGGNQPTSYGIQILDSNGNDLLCGHGTTRSITATEYLTKPQGAVANDQLQLVISAAGNAKQGVAYLYLR